MAINLTAGAVVYSKMIEGFSKTLSYVSVTKTTDNFTGDETLLDGSTSSISGVFYRQEDVWSQNNPGLLQGADAVVMVLPAVVISKDSKIVYDGETYRIDKVTTRRLGDVEYYKVGRCFLV